MKVEYIDSTRRGEDSDEATFMKEVPWSIMMYFILMII